MADPDPLLSKSEIDKYYPGQEKSMEGVTSMQASQLILITASNATWDGFNGTDIKAPAAKALDGLVADYPEAAKKAAQSLREIMAMDDPKRARETGDALGLLLDTMEQRNIPVPGDPLVNNTLRPGVNGNGKSNQVRASQLILDAATLATSNQSIIDPQKAKNIIDDMIAKNPEAALIALEKLGGLSNGSKAATFLSQEMDGHYVPQQTPAQPPGAQQKDR